MHLEEAWLDWGDVSCAAGQGASQLEQFPVASCALQSPVTRRGSMECNVALLSTLPSFPAPPLWPFPIAPYTGLSESSWESTYHEETMLEFQKL